MAEHEKIKEDSVKICNNKQFQYWKSISNRLKNSQLQVSDVNKSYQISLVTK
jgi:hypothetical protein